MKLINYTKITPFSFFRSLLFFSSADNSEVSAPVSENQRARKYFSLLNIPFLLILIIISSCQESQNSKEDLHIKAWDQNPSYWQYKGQPVLLLGGSNDDNLFQWTNDRLTPHLDSMITIGANYVRNTMGAPPYNGFEVQIYKQLDSGRYDLDQWNDEYWQRFDNFLRQTADRDIIVQVEVWDRFDHSRSSWLTNPYNPNNNINYTMEESCLDTIYPLSATKNVQPFFFTVPALDNNKLLLKYQNEFVLKLLTVSLKYDHVLYCLDNETTVAEEWPVYWAGFIQANAGEKDIYITEMWGGKDIRTNKIHLRTIDHPERFRYIELNELSHNTVGRDNWDNAQFAFDYIKENPRPVNSVKIYGNDLTSPDWFRRGYTTHHGVQTFCRNVVGGFAASRFHRPIGGLGLGQVSAKVIQTIRKIELYVKMWEITPRMDLLQGADDNQAYLAAKEGEKYLVYFPSDDQVKLNLEKYNTPFTLRWISTDDAIWSGPITIHGGKWLEMKPLSSKNSFALIIKK